jgi:hypothetical protein
VCSRKRVGTRSAGREAPRPPMEGGDKPRLRLLASAQGIQDYAGEDAQYACDNEQGGQYGTAHSQAACRGRYVNHPDAENKTSQPPGCCPPGRRRTGVSSAKS